MSVRLRALEPEDLSALYGIENEMDVWDCGTANTPISMFTLRQYIANCKNDIFEDGQVRLVVDVDGELVGLVDLANFQPLHRRAEVGIVIVSAKRHCGLGKEALRLLEDYARRILGLHQLYAIVASSNIVARRLFTCSNYVEAQKLKDWLFSPSGEVQDACLFQCFLR